MKTAFIILALGAFVAGCGLQAVDPCANVKGACVALQLDSSPTVAAFDSLSLHVAGTGVATEDDSITEKGRTVTLPAAVAVVLDGLIQGDAAVTFTVTVMRGGQIEGVGDASATVSTGQHQTIHIAFTASTETTGDDMGLDNDGGGDCAPGTHNCGSACVDSTSVNHCGSSCSPCPVPANATAATCDGASCGLTCLAGFHICNGACVSNSDPNSCGTSCTPCTAPSGGTGSCDGSSCGGSCPPGQQLCAGACIPSGMVCSGTCPAGTHNCSGLCAMNNSVNSCGTSCTACSVPNGATMAACDGTNCGFTCDANHTRCNGGCIPLSACCTDSDCSNAAGHKCVSGACGCASAIDCSPLQACTGGHCAASCDANHPCSSGCCSNGQCVSACPVKQACGSTGQCSTTCDATHSCNTGCCSNGQCANGTDVSACGSSGQCSVCSNPAPYCDSVSCGHQVWSGGFGPSNFDAITVMSPNLLRFTYNGAYVGSVTVKGGNLSGGFSCSSGSWVNQDVSASGPTLTFHCSSAPNNEVVGGAITFSNATLSASFSGGTSPMTTVSTSGTNASNWSGCQVTLN